MKNIILIIVGLVLLGIIVMLSIRLAIINNEVSNLNKDQTELTGAVLYDLSNTPDGYGYDIKIWIPRDVLYVDTCCSYATTFASLKSVEVLEQEVKQIMDEHYEVVDGGYYDAENDSKIFDYTIEEGNIMNYIIYTY